MQNPGQFEENFYFASFNSQFAKGLSFLQTLPFDPDEIQTIGFYRPNYPVIWIGIIKQLSKRAVLQSRYGELRCLRQD